MIAKYPNPDLINILITKKANINARTDKGLTPLHFAIERKCNKNIIGKLIENGADILAIDIYDRSVSHYMMRFPVDSSIIFSILEKSNLQHINLKDNGGFTPLITLILANNNIKLIQDIVSKYYKVIDFPSHTFPDHKYNFDVIGFKFHIGQTLMSFLDQYNLLTHRNPMNFIIPTFEIARIFEKELNYEKAIKYYNFAALLDQENHEIIYRLAITHNKARKNEFTTFCIILSHAAVSGSEKANFLLYGMNNYKLLENNKLIDNFENMINELKDFKLTRGLLDFLSMYPEATIKRKLFDQAMAKAPYTMENSLYDNEHIDNIELLYYDPTLAKQQLKKAKEELENKNNKIASTFWLFLSMRSHMKATKNKFKAIPPIVIHFLYSFTNHNLKAMTDMIVKAFPSYGEITDGLFYSDELYRKVGKIIMNLGLQIQEINESNIDGVVEAIISYNDPQNNQAEQLTNTERKQKSQIKNCLIDMFL